MFGALTLIILWKTWENIVLKFPDQGSSKLIVELLLVALRTRHTKTGYSDRVVWWWIGGGNCCRYNWRSSKKFFFLLLQTDNSSSGHGSFVLTEHRDSRLELPDRAPFVKYQSMLRLSPTLSNIITVVLLGKLDFKVSVLQMSKTQAIAFGCCLFESAGLLFYRMTRTWKAPLK